MRNGFMPLFLILSFSQFLLLSCSVELPSDIIPQGKMERILYDYHLAQGMAEAQGGDVAQNRYLYVQKVFEKHGIAEAEFDSSMVWYSGHASYLTEMYDHIENRLDRESRDAGLNIPEEDKFARFTAEGDTANVWQGRDVLCLHGNREENLYSLVIPADSTFRKGDYFMLRFSNRFVTQDRQREAFILLQIRYDNDSVVGTSAMVAGDYDATLNIPQTKVSADHDIRSISCTFYYAFDEQQPDAFRLWMVRKPVLLRYHAMKGEVRKDSAQVNAADTLQGDTTGRAARSSGERISPEDFRKSQDVEHKINVVGKRDVALPPKGNTTKKRKIENVR